MSITESPEKYKTNDGFCFNSMDEAECHQECLTAIEEFQRAQQRLFAAIAAKHYLTADGKPFSLSYSNYWIVVETINEPPYAIPAEIRWYSSQTTYFFNERSRTLCIKWRDGDKEFEYPVSDFYTSELAARQSALKRRQQHLDFWKEDLRDEEEKVARLYFLRQNRRTNETNKQ